MDRRRLLVASVGLATALFAAVLVGTAAQPADTTGQTVRIVIDYNDGIQKVFAKIHLKAGMTVRDAMDAAQSSGHGIKYESKGSGETAFLTRVDDVQSQGGRGDKKNWVYTVNQKLADRGFGVYKLNAGDEVLWKFEPPRPGR